jgi:parallel beta-helix repeat protein
MRQRHRSHLTYANTPATFVSLAVILALAVVGVVVLGGGKAAAVQQLSCGDTITADTTLHKNLVNCPNNGIIIGADDVTLDLNYHTIDGDGETPAAGCNPETEACDFGVLNDGHDGVTIKGGTVREFGPGVVVVRARHNRLLNLASLENAFEGIVMFRSARSLVQGSSASRNGHKRADRDPGLVLVESHDNRIAHNTMSRNGDLGLFMADSDHNHVSHNKARRNPEGGMIAEGDRNVFSRNRVFRGGGGILITIVSRGGKAVGNVIRRNEVRDARAGGISVDRGPKRTTLRRNRVVGSGRGGIMVGGPATKLIANSAVRNDGDGIDVRSRSTELTRNRALRNGDLGIRAVRGVIDGGGNVARHNGDPRQCINIVCR